MTVMGVVVVAAAGQGHAAPKGRKGVGNGRNPTGEKREAIITLKSEDMVKFYSLPQVSATPAEGHGVVKMFCLLHDTVS